jgi:hypothetical protein
MKKLFSIILVIACSVLACGSCRIVEVGSVPRSYKIAVVAGDSASYQLRQLGRNGTFEPVKQAGPGHYLIAIPAMDGGYSDFIGIKYNKHIPEEYPVIQLVKNGRIIRELSINDMEKLPLLRDVRQLKAE